ncbi:hypothetical protein VE03_03558 [Pseudogymnoascus sp. 23342-1-I1]|nr:hypothetical protein VE03_03558 [Pseudogymnoascus sp. 23342-1-I1]
MAAQKPIITPSITESSSPSDHVSLKSKEGTDVKHGSGLAPHPLAPLATQENQRMEAVLGDAILRFVGIRKGQKKDEYDLDAVATQPSIWDSENVEEYKQAYIHPKWENWSAFDPSARWTWREEKAVRRKVDWKIMTWVCIMFFALNTDRGNIKNAVSDNMLDDLILTKNDYNLGQTISRVGFLVAELPSQLISKRATFQGGFIPDTILYLSYFYTGKSLPIRLAWFWLFSALADIGVSFAAVGLLSMRGIRGYAGWQWLFLIEGAFTFLIGAASFFLMPQSPAKTKSWWKPKGYFTEKEEKIIVNSVIRDDPHKGGMFNRQGLSVKQIWESVKDYDMWPLYALGLLFGLPKYPVDQYLTLSFRSLGFTVIETNLLTIPSTVGYCLLMLIITAVSELVNNRSIVSMAEDAWLLPCFIALIALPDPIGPWDYFAIATVLLSYPYTHPIQVAWTSRNAGTVQNRTVSASLYNMWVQVSGMIGANIYQSEDSPRYFKANKGFSKAKKWNALTSEEQDHYRTSTADVGNKRLDFRFAT